MAEITLESVSKVYGEDVFAVKDMNLDIPDGEFVVLVGPSGTLCAHTAHACPRALRIRCQVSPFIHPR